MIDIQIQKLLCDLKKHHRSKADILYSAVKDRLSKSLDSYVSDLNSSFEYLARRKPDSIMRKLTK